MPLTFKQESHLHELAQSRGYVVDCFNATTINGRNCHRLIPVGITQERIIVYVDDNGFTVKVFIINLFGRYESFGLEYIEDPPKKL